MLKETPTRASVFMLPSLYRRVRACARRAELSVSRWLQLVIERAVRIDEGKKNK